MKLKVIKGDITTMTVDVIVNAANTSLLGGGGVDGAIHRQGGKAILEECRKIVQRQGGCKTGEAVITTAGELTAKYVIHTVGPVFNNYKNDEAALLSNCYFNSLKIASEYKATSIAFPNISTGIYHFPKDKAAEIAIKSVTGFFMKINDTSIKEVCFVCFDDVNYALYQKLITGRRTSSDE